MKTNVQIAKEWREANGYTGKRGVVVLLDGEVQSWVGELCRPSDWIPGCVSVDEHGNCWEARDGNDLIGAREWVQI